MLINSIPVVGEVNSTTIIDDVILAGIYAAKYDDLVGACKHLATNDLERQNLIRANSISLHPQSVFTSGLLRQ